jgi:uncharacterized phiE125 gp8 family phage protein
MKVEIVSAATELPLSLALVKNHLRIDHNDDDTYIQTLIHAASGFCEQYTGLTLLETTVKEYFDSWPQNKTAEPWWNGVRLGTISEVINGGAANILYLSKRPATSIVSFVWTHEDGTTTTWDTDEYLFSPSVSKFEKGRLGIKSGATIPDLLADMDALQVSYKVGYGTNENKVPMDLRVSILHFIDHYYRNRSVLTDGLTEVPFNCLAIWRQYRSSRVC